MEMKDLHCPKCGRTGKVVLHGFDMAPYVLKPSGPMGCFSEEQRYIINYSCFDCGSYDQESIVPASFIKGFHVTFSKEVTTPLTRFLKSQTEYKCKHFMLNTQCRLCEGFQTQFCPCNGNTCECKLLTNLFKNVIKKED